MVAPFLALPLALPLAMAMAMPVASALVMATATPAMAQSATQIVYVPPVKGAPSGRVGGGTRGPGAPGEGAQDLEVLAPDHIGLTASAQPTLLWFLGAPVTGPVEVVIDTADLTGAPPLLEERLPQAPQPGINAVDLAAKGVRLDPGVTYRWSVAVVVDPAQRSSDIVASALIRHAPPSPPPEMRAGDPAAAAIAFASRGYWYDAMTALARGLAARPGQDQLRRLRVELLEQVGLSAPARFEQAAAVTGMPRAVPKPSR
jgi:hypothetical protein